jgi:hypothetical protein
MKTLQTAATRRIWEQLFWISLYATAMGLLEAICAIYMGRRLVPFDFDPLQRPPPMSPHHLRIEPLREVCTLLMMAAVAWLAGKNLRQRTAHFLIIFGVWDIFYYVGLRWLAGWPPSWMEWDCLFLIPVRWYSPVLAPVLISGYFALGFGWLLLREARVAPLRLSPVVVLIQTIAILSQAFAVGVWYWSFVKDSLQISTGKVGYGAAHYSWELFAFGLIVGVSGLWLAAHRPREAEVPVSREA